MFSQQQSTRWPFWEKWIWLKWSWKLMGLGNACCGHVESERERWVCPPGIIHPGLTRAEDDSTVDDKLHRQVFMVAKCVFLSDTHSACVGVTSLQWNTFLKQLQMRASAFNMVFLATTGPPKEDSVQHECNGDDHYAESRHLKVPWTSYFSTYHEREGRSSTLHYLS